MAPSSPALPDLLPDGRRESPASISLSSRPWDDPDERQGGSTAAWSPDGRGIPASEGVAIGPVFAFFPEAIEIPDRTVAPADVDDELDTLRRAVDATTAGLIESKLKPGLSPEDTHVLEALIEIARDGSLAASIESGVRAGRNAVRAVVEAGEALAAEFASLEDAYLRARAEDVDSVTRALALRLMGKTDPNLADMPSGAVLVADEVSAWDFAKLPLASLAGVLCRKGAATSHIAIMARTHAIPVVLGFGCERTRLQTARTVAIDGRTGDVFLDPPPSVQADVERRIHAEGSERQALAAFRSVQPRTHDGRLIEVAANLGSLKEVDAARAAGAMGVGLFRTELLFMERTTLPSEDEQAAVYGELAAAFAPYPVVVRTLDIGGDKPLAAVRFPHEDNPFLGWRGVRMCLDRPDVFKPQLKALLRAATRGNIKIMAPMITQVEEVLRIKALLSECRAELEAAGLEAGRPDFGLMMETPAAALLAPELAKHAAFFSIGTNDLTQYVMAADRLNPRVAELNRADHPAVMRAVELICDAARVQGIWVGICGESAARPDLIPIYLRMGITELSMSPASIPRAKRAVVAALQ